MYYRIIDEFHVMLYIQCVNLSGDIGWGGGWYSRKKIFYTYASPPPSLWFQRIEVFGRLLIKKASICGWNYFIITVSFISRWRSNHFLKNYFLLGKFTVYYAKLRIIIILFLLFFGGSRAVLNFTQTWILSF